MAASGSHYSKNLRNSMVQEARHTEKHTKWADARVNLRSKRIEFVGGGILPPLVLPPPDPGEEISSETDDLEGGDGTRNGSSRGKENKSIFVLNAGIHTIAPKKVAKVAEASIIIPAAAPVPAAAPIEPIQRAQVQKAESKDEEDAVISDPLPRSPSPATSEEKITFVPKKLRAQVKPEIITASSSDHSKQVELPVPSKPISASKATETSELAAANEPGNMKDLLKLIKGRKLQESFASHDLGGEPSTSVKPSRKPRRNRFHDNSDEEPQHVTPNIAKSREDFWGPSEAGKAPKSEFDQLVDNIANLGTVDMEVEDNSSDSEAYLDSSSGISDLEDAESDDEESDDDEENLEPTDNLAEQLQRDTNGGGTNEDANDDDDDDDGMDFDPRDLLDMVNMVVKPKPNGEFPSASKLADAYDEFDVMDYERPSLQQRHKKGKAKGKALEVPQDFDDEYDLARNLLSAHQADRNRKKMKKATRENYRKLGLLTAKKDGQPDLRAKYSREFTFDNVKTEIKAFLLSEHDSLPLPPMDRDERKEVHLLANRLLLKSKSLGHGAARHTVLTKSEKNKKWENNAVLVESILNSNKSFRHFGTVGHLNKKPRPRDGDIVGAGAAEIGQNNVGRVILEKLGWTAGTGLGAGRDGRIDPVSAYHRVTRHGLG